MIKNIINKSITKNSNKINNSKTKLYASTESNKDIEKTNIENNKLPLYGIIIIISISVICSILITFIIYIMYCKKKILYKGENKVEENDIEKNLPDKQEAEIKKANGLKYYKNPMGTKITLKNRNSWSKVNPKK